MHPIRFAIIGCGRIAQRHAEHINKVGKLVATCDVIPEKAKALAQQYGAVHFQDVDELLKTKDLDVVAICSPNGMHAFHSIKALNAGFHVLCEKPMALTVQDCGEMINAAERANKRLFIVKQNRFNPPVAAIKKIIEEGKLGKLYSVQLSCFWNRNAEYYKDSWKGTKDMDGGTLFTQFSHFIDLLYWIIGDVKEAQGYAGNFGHKEIIEFEDTGVVSLKFYNGVVGTVNYTVTSHQKNMEGSLTIFAEKGTVKIGGQYLNELEYQNIANYTISDLPPGNPPNNYGQYQGSMSNHDKVYQNVVDVLTGKGIIATHGYEGLKTVEIIDKIYSSVRSI
ncbi:Gfo/Idh/MocA family oxidoreductase [Niastella caeni]|uniref:Gfo/Idh/MocA family oxidoreductase n=1 Tax=Niastella caeni TaxID=2569763 RepID=A0A4S8I0N6_9BACT|nr:Gfo/Idh/MocA family oxidoreductase [Niastella caeni]THU41520.1 Gfo/Idh/MocA family oxidoreductase [Niastella caeni]